MDKVTPIKMLETSANVRRKLKETVVPLEWKTVNKSHTASFDSWSTINGKTYHYHSDKGIPDETYNLGQGKSVAELIDEIDQLNMKMSRQQARGQKISEDDRIKLEALGDRLIEQAFDLPMLLAISIAVISYAIFCNFMMFFWQSAYIYGMNRIMKNQKKLEDWFMGLEVAGPPRAP